MLRIASKPFRVGLRRRGVTHGVSSGISWSLSKAFCKSAIFTTLALILAALLGMLQIWNFKSEIFNGLVSPNLSSLLEKYYSAKGKQAVGDEQQLKTTQMTTVSQSSNKKLLRPPVTLPFRAGMPSKPGIIITQTSEDVEGNVYPLIAYRDGRFGINVYEEEGLVRGEIVDGYNKNGFNQFLSDLLPVHRHLPDVRGAPCKAPGRHLHQLPKASVVITFRNEAWSTLLRTVHSILDRTPPHLLTEIILVDDFSNMAHLKTQLDEYMSNYGKVKIFRTLKREGLIRGRLIGAAQAEGPVLVFLDAHCEATEGWLEPLLDRIARNRTTVACPVIDVITAEDIIYRSEVPIRSVGGFDWSLTFMWIPIPEEEKRRIANEWEPVRSPAMAGGLFAIDKQFFNHIGGYDPDFEIWGAEHLELSFKAWMCGGSLEIVPCSHVGHIYRVKRPANSTAGLDILTRNNIRLAEVWMDDFALYYYQKVGDIPMDVGDVTARQELRESLQCRSFSWYLETVYPQQTFPGKAIATGEVRNLANPFLCLDSVGGVPSEKQEIGVFFCHGLKQNQFWVYTDQGEILQGNYCLDWNPTADALQMWQCHGLLGNQEWHYDPHLKLIIKYDLLKCLALSPDQQKLNLEECDPNETRQQWQFEFFSFSHEKKYLFGSSFKITSK